MLRALAIALVVGITPRASFAEEPKPKATASLTEQLQGTWLFDEAMHKKRSELGRVRDSVVTVKGDSFALSQLMGCKNDLKGTLVFDATDPKVVDLKIAALDLSELLPDYKLSAGTLPAIYKLDDDRLTLCFPRDYKRKRPTAFAASAENFLVTLRRAPAEFKEFPKELTLTVTRPDGTPAAGVTVGGFMYQRNTPEQKGAASVWEYSNPGKTGANGSITLKAETVQGGQLVVRDTANGTMAFVPVSPAKRANGQFRATLARECKITGTLTCDELTKAGQPIGPTNVYLIADGAPVASWASKDGKFEFLAPPGKYVLNPYGSEVGSEFVTVTVPTDRTELAFDPIPLTARAFALLKGRAAPELVGVVAWSGEKVTFADLKGKYVLMEFWGYWCGPCVGSMPVLIELHEKFADKGLAIVGVHMDIDGEVDTPAKLDAKLAGYVKDEWKGKKIPFPNALVPGTRIGMGDEEKRGGAIAQYGIQSYPTCLLIDREGKVVGQFHARDIKQASAEIEKLLNPKK
ncbi:Thiol-disulfide oxidoreductase ResA [Gemmata sp. SH-PL17]|uniref:redoxin domain-containing protein n=1 Tax=Gemmata sp. SH-PL17 TaxID=1630693 RepID=UPI0004B64877|nr:redoxin domain-containing protein [Gemmata sp. SH-PL17]AMV26997.1 Thiol-disulfide oxidoreductase ResA [Gemmata sp. SH-PL17]